MSRRKTSRARVESHSNPPRLNLTLMEQGVDLLLQGMGVDRTDSNFRDTPKRVAKMYAELLTPPANNWTSFPSPTRGMIVLRGHRVFALCPHHLLPVELSAFVAYIPCEKVLGLSKLARVVEQQLVTPMMQEQLGDQTADTLDAQLSPQGVAVILSGAHSCMRARGVESHGDVVTSALRGLFLHSDQTRQELFALIGRP